MSPYLTPLASLLGTTPVCLTDSRLLYWQLFTIWCVPCVSLGGVPCALLPPMTLLSWCLNWGVSPMNSGLLHRQPFTIWGGGSCVPGGRALHATAPHDTPFMGPCRPDPEVDISAGLHLCHGVWLSTLHPPFFNGGKIGSPSSSSLGRSSVPSFWRHHGGPSFSSPLLLLLVIMGGLPPPPLILLVIMVGLPSPFPLGL